MMTFVYSKNGSLNLLNAFEARCYIEKIALHDHGCVRSVPYSSQLQGAERVDNNLQGLGIYVTWDSASRSIFLMARQPGSECSALVGLVT
jgi:hypothetical protein